MALLSTAHKHYMAGRLRELFSFSPFVFVLQPLGAVRASKLTGTLQEALDKQLPESGIVATAFKLSNTVAGAAKGAGFAEFFQASNYVVGWQMPPRAANSSANTALLAGSTGSSASTAPATAGAQSSSSSSSSSNAGGSPPAAKDSTGKGSSTSKPSAASAAPAAGSKTGKANATAASPGVGVAGARQALSAAPKSASPPSLKAAATAAKPQLFQKTAEGKTPPWVTVEMLRMRQVLLKLATKTTTPLGGLAGALPQKPPPSASSLSATSDSAALSFRARRGSTLPSLLGDITAAPGLPAHLPHATLSTLMALSVKLPEQHPVALIACFHRGRYIKLSQLRTWTGLDELTVQSGLLTELEAVAEALLPPLEAHGSALMEALDGAGAAGLLDMLDAPRGPASEPVPSESATA